MKKVKCEKCGGIVFKGSGNFVECVKCGTSVILPLNKLKPSGTVTFTFYLKKTKKMKKDEMKCLSCDKVIKTKNLIKHSSSKTHLKNVQKKVDFMKNNCN